MCCGSVNTVIAELVVRQVCQTAHIDRTFSLAAISAVLRDPMVKKNVQDHHDRFGTECALSL